MSRATPMLNRMLLRLFAALLIGLAALVSVQYRPTVPALSARNSSGEAPRLLLEAIDSATGKPTPARFSLMVDDKPFYPEKVGDHGLRFVSVHDSRQQVFVVTYTRGTGPVEVTLPLGSRRVAVHVAKGLEYLPAVATRDLDGDPVQVKVEMRRWINLVEKGWTACDEHVHYDRLDRNQDKDWLTMLAGDDLRQAHFMVLKGGKVPGIWARQYAYGKEGEAFDGERLIRPGEEYRDGAQGHINLLGVGKVIEPISTGGIGQPSVTFNYPPLLDVFRQCRELGGLGGVAHGGSLSRQPTAVADTVLGGVDFFEIGNTHLYALELWYRLMSCGFPLPPAAGTDPPNYPFRDLWQPFLGSMRMYVQVGAQRDFDTWKQAVLRGEVFVTSGPLLSFTVNGVGPGQIVRLPAGGGAVTIEAELATPIGLRTFEIVQNGKVLPADIDKTKDGPVHRWRIRKRLDIYQSCWLAARGEGVAIESLAELNRQKQPWTKTEAIAHAGAVRVLVGDRPVWSATDGEQLIALLRQQQEFYRTKGNYETGKDRLHALELFDKAIEVLKKRGAAAADR